MPDAFADAVAELQRQKTDLDQEITGLYRARDSIDAQLLGMFRARDLLAPSDTGIPVSEQTMLIRLSHTGARLMAVSRRYIRDQWEAAYPALVKKGDYVVATKYRDGDPGDQFCVGFYDYSYQNVSSTRHMVVDRLGNQFRANGFRRMARVGAKRGSWMVRNLGQIEELQDRFSVWHWWRAPWRELNTMDGGRG